MARIVWKEKEVEEMLNVIREKSIMKLLDGKQKRNKDIYDIVEKDMIEKGFKKNSIQIRTKFKSLKSEYFKIKRNNNSSGASRMTCQYFDILEEIFGSRPAASFEGVDTSIDESLSITETVTINEQPIQSEVMESVEAHYIEVEEEITNSEPKPGPSREKESAKKRSYQKAVSAFSAEWKEMHSKMIDALQAQDEFFAKEMEKQRKFEQELLKHDREETASMLKELTSTFLSRHQNQPAPSPLMYQHFVPINQFTHSQPSTNHSPTPTPSIYSISPGPFSPPYSSSPQSSISTSTSSSSHTNLNNIPSENLPDPNIKQKH